MRPAPAARFVSPHTRPARISLAPARPRQARGRPRAHAGGGGGRRAGLPRANRGRHPRLAGSKWKRPLAPHLPAESSP
jgi:hypothetical protein